VTRHRWGRQHLVISCEHASNRLPKRFGALGLSRAQLASHACWDPGAGPVARALVRRFDAPYFAGSYSRVLIDLNRPARHPNLVPRVSFGMRVPGNAAVGRADAAERLELVKRILQFHLPYHHALSHRLGTVLDGSGRCLHLSIHSFAPRLRGETRNADIGLLYDPGVRREAAIAAALGRFLNASGLRVRMNYPYRGTASGCVTECRRLFHGRDYAGLEIELNQRVVKTAAQQRRIARLLGDALRAVFSAKLST
jgi:predicted N-formylglutamate amidohydrolase